MTPDQLKELRKSQSLSQSDLVEVPRVRRYTVARLEMDRHPIPPFLHLALEALESRLLRWLSALDALERSGVVITFPLVAGRAGVSRSWLYKQQTLRDRIARLRREHPWPAHAPVERASDASKEAVIRTLRQRLADEGAAQAKLVAENKQLRKINEVLAGEVYYCGSGARLDAGAVAISWPQPARTTEASTKTLARRIGTANVATLDDAKRRDQSQRLERRTADTTSGCWVRQSALERPRRRPGRCPLSRLRQCRCSSAGDRQSGAYRLCVSALSSTHPELAAYRADRVL
jgi:transcriptional regulator with XRE-family HTH domain